MPELNYYEMLGVERDADEDAIDHAYLRAMRRAHPDVNGKAGEALAKYLNQIKSTLSDPSARAEYDRSLDGSAGHNDSTDDHHAEADDDGPVPDDAAGDAAAASIDDVEPPTAVIGYDRRRLTALAVLLAFGMIGVPFAARSRSPIPAGIIGMIPGVAVAAGLSLSAIALGVWLVWWVLASWRGRLAGTALGVIAVLVASWLSTGYAGIGLIAVPIVIGQSALAYAVDVHRARRFARFMADSDRVLFVRAVDSGSGRPVALLDAVKNAVDTQTAVWGDVEPGDYVRMDGRGVVVDSLPSRFGEAWSRVA
jgi:hypothetical protein